MSRLSALPSSTDLHEEFRCGWHRLEIRTQAIHHTTEGTAVAAEALLRWRRNDTELWAAAMVMPLAEESGRIEEFTSWATELAMTVWSSSDHRARGGRLALNLHHRQLVRPRLADELAMTARALQIAAGELIFEIPDRLGPDACRAAIETLRPLHDAGALLALDDHRGAASATAPDPGWLPTGSLVKLDPDLVFATHEADGHDELLRTTDRLREMGYVAVAEGVEQQSQLDSVIACGIPFAQGYLFGRPCPLV